MKPRPHASFAESALARRNEAMRQEPASIIGHAREAQQLWGLEPVEARLRILRKFRHALAESGRELAETVPCELPGSLHRTVADTLVSEVLPLAEAGRFLEREAASILAPQRPGNESRPFWLRGVSTEIRREPLGVILVIGPGNYPLFLPGVQALQALAAGNAVLWKPAPGGVAAAKALRLLLIAGGLDPSLLQILDEAPSAATTAIRDGVDKVFMTGSEATCRAVMLELTETTTPSVMELSGCDAVFVLDGANLDRVVAALAFGLRLNGSATCMAPRRLFATKVVADRLIDLLVDALDSIPPVRIPAVIHEKMLDLMADAEAKGAIFRRNGLAAAAESDGVFSIRPTLIAQATPVMRITQADIFAPVLSVIEIADAEEALAANSCCPYALTAAVFGPRKAAERLASRIPAGTVLINDIVVSTADPRAPFGGRKRSGFGATRGREGLLEMTTVKTIQTQNARDLRAYTPHTPHHERFFDGYLRAAHGGSWRARLAGLRDFLNAMMKLK
jgi:acyl-CoA reductase-like NAD-dependent aldehyde dehydrogenase